MATNKKNNSKANVLKQVSNIDFKKYFKTGFYLLAAGFILLFVLRFFWGHSYGANRNYIYSEGSFSDEFGKKNYASSKYKLMGVIRNRGSQIHGNRQTMDQKYEKVASLSSKTNHFEADEKKLRATLSEEKSLVQYEKRSGVPGGRILQLSAGVPPENFDESVEKLKKIGTVLSLQITKEDKTNEFNELNAKKKTLEKTRTSLISLKNRGGKIDELVNLENRILEIEEKIQKLGINLGEFDEKNEFCTLKIILREKHGVSISWVKKALDAFAWTIKVYAGFVFVLLLGSSLILIVLIILQKIKNLLSDTK